MILMKRLVMQIAVLSVCSLEYQGNAGNAVPNLCTHVVVQMRVCVTGRLALPLSKVFSKKALSSPWIIQALFLPIPCWSSCPLFPISIINGLLISLKQAPYPSGETPLPLLHLKSTTAAYFTEARWENSWNVYFLGRDCCVRIKTMDISLFYHFTCLFFWFYPVSQFIVAQLFWCKNHKVISVSGFEYLDSFI